MAGKAPSVVSDRVKMLRGLTYVVDPPLLGLDMTVLRPVFDYWAHKRAGRKMPGRADIDPLELKPFLRHLVLIEVLGGGEFRYRLVGSEITERYGRNGTGKTVRELYANIPAAGEWLAEMLREVVAQAKPVLATGPLNAIKKEHVFSEALHLPLADDGETVTMILGATRYSPLGRA